MNDNFSYRGQTLYVENLSLLDVANEFGTPCYIYSRKQIENNFHAFDKTLGNFPHQICYAVKANSNLAILNLLAELHSGFDIVSLGELERVIAAKGLPQKIVFSGVGKTAHEISRALDLDIFCFNVESEVELELLQKLAKDKNKKVKVALRVNPNIDAQTHHYISTGLNENKFGIDKDSIESICKKLKNFSHIELIGLACHIGSQLTSLEPFNHAIDFMLALIDRLAAMQINITYLNLGGGLGVQYRDEKIISIKQYVENILNKLQARNVQLILEPGRAIIANAGILLTRVEILKKTFHKNFAITDAGMNDLIRPALYDAWQDIIPVHLKKNVSENIYEVVGPVCETSDFLGKNRSLAIEPGDWLAILTTGAYGFSMSSNYNSRPRAAEVLVDGDKAYLIRERETIQDLFAKEKLI